MMNALDNHGLSVVQHRKRTVKRLGRIKEDVFNEKEEIEMKTFCGVFLKTMWGAGFNTMVKF